VMHVSVPIHLRLWKCCPHVCRSLSE
jgi:hypothetical protein